MTKHIENQGIINFKTLSKFSFFYASKGIFIELLENVQHENLINGSSDGSKYL